MLRFLIAIGAVLITASAFAAPVRKPTVPQRAESPQASPVGEQVMSLEKSLIDAQKRRDRDFYKSTLADDFLSVDTDGKVHPKVEILGDLPSTELSEYRPYNMQVVSLNDNAAIVTYDLIVRKVHYDDETPRYQHVSSVWVKQVGQWRLKFQQATPGT
jgi:hypothetical protein